MLWRSSSGFWMKLWRALGQFQRAVPFLFQQLVCFSFPKYTNLRPCKNARNFCSSNIDIPAQRIMLANSVEGIALKCASSAIFQLLITRQFSKSGICYTITQLLSFLPKLYVKSNRCQYVSHQIKCTIYDRFDHANLLKAIPFKM